MNDERLKQAFDKMTPDSQSEKRMLAEIIRKGESYMDRKFTVEPVKPSRWAAIPAVMAILAMIALSVFVAVRFDRNSNTANDPTQEHDTVPNVITEPDTHLDSEVPPNHEDSPEPMTIPSYGELVVGCTPVEKQLTFQSYEEILENYLKAIEEDWEADILENLGLNPYALYCSTSTNLGYQYIDLDDNGQEELIISDNLVIIDLYTVTDSGIKCILRSRSERIYASLCLDNIIVCVSNSSTQTTYCFYRYENGVLYLVESLVYDGEATLEERWRINTSKVITITQEDAQKILDSYLPAELHLTELKAHS